MLHSICHHRNAGTGHGAEEQAAALISGADRLELELRNAGVVHSG